MIKIGEELIEGDVEICCGENVSIVRDGNRIIISAPSMNKTTIKERAFTLSGDHVEFLAGTGIKITSAMPNKITISVSMDKYIADVGELKNRFVNIEKAFSHILKQIRKPTEVAKET